MNNTDLTIRAIPRQVVFPFAGWIMLAVIMVFAMAGGSQAQLRAIGSAFDPSTTAVSLSPKQRPLAAKIAVLQSGLPDVAASSSPGATVSAYAVATTSPVLFLPWRPASDVGLGHSRFLAKPVGARAPPHR